MIYRIIRLTTRLEDKQASLQALFDRLVLRGYNPDWLYDFIVKTTPIIEARLATPPPVKSLHEEYAVFFEPNTRLFLHLMYHPQGPTRKQIQQLFREHISFPKDEPPFAKLENYDGVRLAINQLIVAYSRPANLRTLVFPRRLRTTDFTAPSTISREFLVEPDDTS